MPPKRVHVKSLFALGAILLSVVIGISQPCAVKNLESYLHKNAILAVPPLSSPPSTEQIQSSELKPISPHEACCHAIDHLEAKGIKNITICEVQWIAAPLSGYLVDLKGELTLDHNEYTTFRIGIADGSDLEAENNFAGKEFAFIAFRKNTEGKASWYPPPGPDYRPKEGEQMPESLLTYEFLFNRERFETLHDRVINEGILGLCD